ncbi:hyalin-like isoform X1 [Asterias rubens]|uniref:hyalin-like isoform X1 n=1 Tax=Asterias rubens TaxID=7604 RepID=UPI0014553676|nr:hyalin-like isoform X1 [Asterias rubens]
MKTLHAVCVVVVVCLLSLLPTPILSQVTGTCRCLNRGVCIQDASINGIRCQCPSGYTGILCEQTLLIDDRIPPVVFNCPSDFEVRREAGQSSVFVTWDEPYATDNSGQAPLVSRNVAPDFYASGNYIFNVIYRYTDQAGLVADCRFAITVLYSEEVQPIFMGCPSDVNMRIQTGISSPVYWVEPVASPMYQGSTSITKSHSPGSVFYVGTTMVTYTFTEFTTGIKSLCTFAVEINADTCRCENGGTCFPDAAMTGIMCQCLAGYTGTICEQNSCSCQNNGVCQYDTVGIMCQCPVGYSGLLCEQVDGDCKCQNGGTCFHDATLPGGTMCVCPEGFSGILCETSADSIPPTITFCPDDIVANIVSDQPVYITWPEPIAVDNSGIAPSVVQNVNSGIFVRAGLVIPVMYRFTDTAGNFALCEFTVSGKASDCGCQNGGTCVHDATLPGGIMCVCAEGFSGILCATPTAVDNIPPTVTFCPDDIVTNIPSDQPVYITWPEPIAVDNSGIAPSVVQNVNSGIFVQKGSVIPVMYRFTDTAGNFALCEFTVSGEDTVPPVVDFCPPDIMATAAEVDAVMFVTWALPRASDNSGQPVKVTSSAMPGIFVVAGTMQTVTYTFTDGSGNQATCSFSIVIEAPFVAGPIIVNCPSDVMLNITDMSSMASGIWLEPTATRDGIMVPIVEQSHQSGSSFGVGETIVKYLFRDSTGTAECVFTVTVTVIIEVPQPPTDVQIVDVTSTSALVTWTAPAANFDSYRLTTISPGSTVVASVDPSQETLELSALIPNTEYTVEVATALGSEFDSQRVSTPVAVSFKTVAIDTIPPVISGCPDDIILPAASNSANWTEPTATDDSGLVPEVSKSHEPGAVFDFGSTNVTYTFTDQAGNAAECVFNINRMQATMPPPPPSPTPPPFPSPDPVTSTPPPTTTPVVDTTPPVIDNCLSFVILPNCSNCGTWLEPTATDDSGEPPMVSSTHQPGFPFSAGSTTVTYTFTDAAGNQAECSFQVFRLEGPVDMPPVISGCPSDITLPLDVTIANWTEPSAMDDTGVQPIVTKSHERGSNFTEGNTTVSYVYTDQAGNSAICSFLVIVTFDTLPPVISDCPSDIVLPLGMTVANWIEPTATDNSGNLPIVVKSHEPGTNFTEGSIVTYTFTDGAGNEAVCSFLVVILDTLPPVISDCPSDIILPLGMTVANWIEPTATDNSGNLPIIIKSHEPGTNFAEGNTTVSYTFFDDAGNQANCTFVVVVTFDTVHPVISGCPSDTVLPLGMTVANWIEPTATDNSGNLPIIIKSHEPGTNFSEGNTTVSYIAIDDAGNQATCTFIVVVSFDTLPPVISGCPSDIILPLGMTVANWIEPTATDNSGNLPIIIKSHEPGTNFAEGNTSVLYTFIDDAGNQANCTFVVVVTFDTLPPVISDCPSDTVLPLGMTVANWIEPTATDNSGNLPIIVKSHEPGTNFAEGNTTVSYTFFDDAGNQANCTFLVVVTFDTLPPVISGCPSDTVLPLGMTVANWIEPTATDNSGNLPTVVKSHEPGTSFAEGNTTVSYIAIDDAGNQADCSFVVFVTLDTLPPVISDCPSDIILPHGMTVANWIEPTATDNSGNLPIVVKSHEPGTSFAEGNTSVSYSFFDDAGNQANCTFLVVVTFDTLPPVISDCPSDIILPLGMTVANWIEPTATDNSGNLPIVVKSHEPGTSFAEGNTSVSYSFFDDAGNQANCTFLVVVTFDTLPPVISDCPLDIILPLGMTVANWIEPTATDNSGNLPTVVKSHEPGTNFSEGNTTVSYTFFDDAGNQANCTFVVIVTLDKTAPVVMNCPSNVSIPYGSNTTSWSEPTATDNAGPVTNAIRSHTPGSTFLDEITMVTYTFTDAQGNQANCVFLVIRLGDDVPPVISGCPSTVVLPPGVNEATWVEPTAVDNSGEAPSVNKSLEPGSIVSGNTTTVVYTFTDAAGNQANCVFFVKTTPVDLPPMVFACPESISVSLLLSEVDEGASTIWAEPFAIDDSGVEPTLVQTHAPGSKFPLGDTTVTYTYSDQADNQANCSFVVSVQSVDDVPPVITGCPANMVLDLPLTQPNIVVRWTEPSAMDESGEAPSLIKTHTPGDSFLEGVTRVRYTFSDDRNNQEECSFDIIVVREADVLPPSIINCPSSQAFVIPAGNQFMIVMWNTPTSIDNSGEQAVQTSNKNSGDVFEEGITLVMYNFTDAAGNVATCEFTITLSTPVLNPCQTRPCRDNENCFYSSNDYICVPGAFRRRRETSNLKEKIGRFIADEIAAPCACMNGGTCSSDDYSEGTRCNCTSGFSGILCQDDVKYNDESFTLTWWYLVAVASLILLIMLSILAFCLTSKTQTKSVQHVYDVTNNI